MNHAMPKRQRDLLIALSTPGLCETVSVSDSVKVSVWGRRFIVPPIGWALHPEWPWDLTDAGILATLEPGEADKIYAEMIRCGVKP